MANDIPKYPNPNPNLTEYWDTSITDLLPQEMLGEVSRFSTLHEFGEWLSNPNPNRLVRTTNSSSGSLHAYSKPTKEFRANYETQKRLRVSKQTRNHQKRFRE